MKKFSTEELNMEYAKWLQTDIGQHFMVWISGLYSDTHKEAEKDGVSNEFVAAKVNEAKGINKIITVLLLHKNQADQQMKAKNTEKEKQAQKES